MANIIFQSIGFSEQDAQQLKLKAQLMRTLINFFHSSNSNSTSNIHKVILSPIQWTNLWKGKLSMFSMDKLVSMLEKLGFEITITCAKSNTIKAVIVKKDPVI